MSKRPVCRHAEVPTDKNGRRVMRHKAYPCRVEVPMPPLPASITKTYNFTWPPHRSWITSDDCAACPLREDPPKDNLT